MTEKHVGPYTITTLYRIESCCSNALLCTKSTVSIFFFFFAEKVKFFCSLQSLLKAFSADWLNFICRKFLSLLITLQMKALVKKSYTCSTANVAANAARK